MERLEKLAAPQVEKSHVMTVVRMLQTQGLHHKEADEHRFVQGPFVKGIFHSKAHSDPCFATCILMLQRPAGFSSKARDARDSLLKIGLKEPCCNESPARATGFHFGASKSPLFVWQCQIVFFKAIAPAVGCFYSSRLARMWLNVPDARPSLAREGTRWPLDKPFVSPPPFLTDSCNFGQVCWVQYHTHVPTWKFSS